MRFLGTQRPGPADVMTMANASCGASAVLVVIAYSGGDDLADTGIRLVALLLLAGTIFDTLDGAFARRSGGTTLGGMLDSLADAITFGLAPAALLFQLGLRDGEPLERVLLVAGFLVYVCGALLRLADFSSARHADSHFTGLPSPLAAVSLLSLAFLTTEPLAIAAGMATAGLMMVSRLSYPMHRGPVVMAAAFAWVFGIAGTLGLYDVRIPAVVALLLIVVLMPGFAALGPHLRSTRSTAH